MRNLRKLTAVVLAIALVLTSMTAAFAASSFEFEAQATTLKDLGIWEGSDGDLMLDKELTRAEGAVMVLKIMFGKTDADQKAADATALDAFDDAAAVPGWATGWMSLAVANKVVTGSESKDGTVKLNAADPLKGKDLASMFMNALGLSDVNEYGKAVELLAAQTKGTILADIAADLQDAELTRDAATAIVYDALTATAKGATKTVIETYVGTNADLKAIADKAGLIVTPAVLDVEKISATNLRELVVTFNKAPNADEAKKTANYKIGSNNPEAVTLSDDGKTVTLRTANANAMGNYKTDVELTVKKEVGFTEDKVVKGISVKDTVVPSALSVKTTGPKNIKVTLSEPLDESVSISDIAASLKIDAGLIAIDNSGVSLGGVELSIRTYSDLAETSHKIEFVTSTNLKDNAGYKLQASTLTFDYVKDASALSFSVVESNETSVTIKFNKAIKASTLVGNANVVLTHTYNTDINKVTGSAITNSGDDQKFVITFGSDKPFPPSATTVYLKYAVDGNQKIEDNYGNKLAATSFAVTTSADMTKPTATAEFVDARTIKVTYSEDVKSSGTNAANNTSNYVLKSGTDVITITGFAYDPADSRKVIKLTTAADALNGTTYTLTIKNVQDLSVAANQIDEVTLTFTGTDKVAPAVKVSDSKLVDTNKFKVVFTEAMDVATITDKSIYKFNGVALDADDKVEAVDSNKAAIITFETAPTAGFTVLVARVKDVAGNWSVAFETPIVVANNTVATVNIKEYQITGKNSIKLKFEDTLKDMVVGDFSYTTGAGAAFITPDAIEVSIVDGNTFITLITKDLASALGTGVSVKSVGTTATKNTFGSTVAFDTTSPVLAIVDKRAPSKSGNLVFTEIADANTTSPNMTLSTIAVTYDEAIYAASVQDTDYTVAGYEVTNVSVVGNVVTITVKTLDYGSYLIGTTEVKVKQVGEIQDIAKNTLGAQDEWAQTARN